MRYNSAEPSVKEQRRNMHGQYIGSLHTMPADIVHQCMLRLDHPSTRCPGKVLHTVLYCSEATAAEGQQSR